MPPQHTVHPQRLCLGHVEVRVTSLSLADLTDIDFFLQRSDPTGLPLSVWVHMEFVNEHAK
jgi:hypothetical protein